jgi:hypothetical protein
VGIGNKSRYSASPRQKTSPKEQRTAAPASVEHYLALIDFSPSGKSISIRLDFCRASPVENNFRRDDQMTDNYHGIPFYISFSYIFFTLFLLSFLS